MPLVRAQNHPWHQWMQLPNADHLLRPDPTRIRHCERARSLSSRLQLRGTTQSEEMQAAAPGTLPRRPRPPHRRYYRQSRENDITRAAAWCRTKTNALRNRRTQRRVVDPNVRRRDRKLGRRIGGMRCGPDRRRRVPQSASYTS